MTLEFVAFFKFEIPSKLILGCTEAEGICISKKLTSKYFSNSYLWTTVNPTTYVFLSRPTFAYRRSARLQEVDKKRTPTKSEKAKYASSWLRCSRLATADRTPQKAENSIIQDVQWVRITEFAMIEISSRCRLLFVCRIHQGLR